MPAEGIHELLRLAARAENEIDDNIKLLPSEFGLMVLEKLAIAKNFFYALAVRWFCRDERELFGVRSAEAAGPQIVR